MRDLLRVLGTAPGQNEHSGAATRPEEGHVSGVGVVEVGGGVEAWPEMFWPCTCNGRNEHLVELKTQS